MKNPFSRLVRRKASVSAGALSSPGEQERLAKIEAELARSSERLAALDRIERQLSRSSAQLEFLNTHGASYLGDGIALTHLADETPIFINSNDYGSPMNFLSGGRYEEDNLALLQSFVTEKTVFVDIGANLGFFTLRLAQRLRESGGRVLAFEPQAHMVELLQRTLHLNGLSEVVTVHGHALSDREGSALLEVPRGHRGAGYIPTPLTECYQATLAQPPERREIVLKRFDALVPEDFRCDLVKIDVEGHELEVLRGMQGVLARSHKVGVLFEKMIREFGNERSLWRFFESLGMALYGVGEEATLQPLENVEALIAWDGGNVFASRDTGLRQQRRRRRFAISARQLRTGGAVQWPEERAPAAVIEGRHALVFGPYWSLPRGAWRITVQGEWDRPIEAILKDRVGLIEVLRRRLAPGEQQFEFQCDQELVKFECVLHAIDQQPTRLVLTAIVFERTDGSAALTYTPPAGTGAALPLMMALPQAPEPQAVPRALKPSQRLHFAIFSNCQGEVLASALQAFTGARMPLINMVTDAALEAPEQILAPLREVAAHHDVLLMQPRIASALLPLVPELAPRIELFPSISFSAFQPDICYVYRARGAAFLQGPMGPYHSSIAYYAWKSGMSVQQAVDQFQDAVYQALRYHDYWDVSTQRLLAEGQAANLPLEGLLARWRRRGCFMHTFNHPTTPVLVDVARALLQRMAIELPAIEPGDFLHDPLASGQVWPVYPEIAARLGVAGSTTFKATNGNQEIRTPIRLFDLEAFVTESFEAYASVDPQELVCDRPYSARYRDVFGEPRRWRGPKPAPKPRAPSAAHPYAGLPAEKFWSRSVAAPDLAAIDPVGTPRFRLKPETRVATAGSCFAQHIARRLQQQGFKGLVTEPAPTALDAATAAVRQYGVYSARYGNLYTARQLLQLFDRAFGEFTPAEPPWLRPDGRLADPFRPEIEPEGFATAAALEADRATHLKAVRRLFETVDVFVFTLGLTEAWQSTVDGAVFPLAPGVAAGTPDAARHAWVNFSVEEVVADLERFVAKLARVNPSAKLLLTVSPVPLAATYGPEHVLAATSYSKSVLRVAAATLCARHAHCDYFPAYEIISSHYHRGSYFAPDLRSVTPAGVDHVMRLFFAHYTEGGQHLAPADAELLAEANHNYLVFCEEEQLSVR